MVSAVANTLQQRCSTCPATIILLNRISLKKSRWDGMLSSVDGSYDSAGSPVIFHAFLKAPTPGVV